MSQTDSKPQDVPGTADDRGDALGRRVAVAASWAIGMRLGERLLGVVSTIILARLLVPEDYGIVAMAMVVIAFVETLSSMGVDAAIISKARPERADYDTAWTLNAILGAGMAIIIAASAVPTAAYFHTPEVQAVLLSLALLPLVGGLENIGIVDFRRNLQFGRDAAFTLSKKLAAFMIAVPLAIAFRSYWALVAGILGGRVAGLMLSFVMSRYRPRLSMASAEELFHFSKWMITSNLLLFLRLRSAEFVTGRLHGATALGVFNMSVELASIPSSELVMPVNRALFPGYAKVAQDPPRLQSGYLKALGVVSLLAVPASIGLALVAQHAVPLLLGDAWLAAVPVVEILAVAGVSTALQISNWSVFLAVRRPEAVVWTGGVHIAMLMLALFALVPGAAAKGAAMAHLVAGIVSLPFSYYMVRRVAGVPIGRIANVIWRPLVASFVMYLAIEGLDPVTSAATASVDSTLCALLLSVALGLVTYLAALVALWRVSRSSDSAELIVWTWIGNCVRSSVRGPADGHDR